MDHLGPTGAGFKISSFIFPEYKKFFVLNFGLSTKSIMRVLGLMLVLAQLMLSKDNAPDEPIPVSPETTAFSTTPEPTTTRNPAHTASTAAKQMSVVGLTHSTRTEIPCGLRARSQDSVTSLSLGCACVDKPPAAPKTSKMQLGLSIIQSLFSIYSQTRQQKPSVMNTHGPCCTVSITK